MHCIVLAADISEVPASCTLSGSLLLSSPPCLLCCVFSLSGQFFCTPQFSLSLSQVGFPCSQAKFLSPSQCHTTQWVHHSLPSFLNLTVWFFHYYRSLFWCPGVPPPSVPASPQWLNFYSLFWAVPLLLWPTHILRPQEAAEKNNGDKSEPSPSPVCKCLASALLFLCPDQSWNFFPLCHLAVLSFSIHLTSGPLFPFKQW